MKNLTFIRIGNKSSISYLKVLTQYNHHILPPIIKMRQLSHYFLNWISTKNLETLYWSENERVSDPAICKISPSNCSKSSSTSHDNPPIPQSVYLILDKLNINTFKLDDKPLDLIFLNNLLSKVSCVWIDNNINMNLKKWETCFSPSDIFSLIQPVRKASQSWLSAIGWWVNGLSDLGIGIFVWFLVTCGRSRRTR